MSLMKNHQHLEHIIRTVCCYYKVNWRELYRPNVRGQAATARLVIYQIVKQTMSRTGAHYLLQLTKGVVNSLRNKPLPEEYELVKGIVGTNLT